MADQVHHSRLHILFENEVGFVGKCPCCKEVRFGIGNVVSFMPEEGFIRLFRSLKKIDRQMERNLVEMPNGRKIMLRTPVDNFLLCLTPSEFKGVLELFSQAALKLRLLKPLEEVEKMN